MIVEVRGEKVKLTPIQWEYLYWLGKSQHSRIEKHLDFKSRHRSTVFYNLQDKGLVTIQRVEKSSFSFYIQPKSENERYLMTNQGACVLLAAIRKIYNMEPKQLTERLKEQGFAV